MPSSRKLVQIIILAIVLGLSSVLVVGIWKGKAPRERDPVPSDDTSDAEMKLTDMEYTEMQDGKRVWMLRASEAKYFKDAQKTQLSSVMLTFFLEGGDEIQLESEQGILYAGTKNIEVWGSVHAALPRGYQLFTERAIYEHVKSMIFSETPIRVSGPDLQLEGSQWEYRIREHRAVVEGGVRGTLLVSPPETEPKSERQRNDNT